MAADLSILTIAQQEELDKLVDRFEQAWFRGDKPQIESFLLDNPSLRQVALSELVHVDIELRQTAGQQVSLESYFAKFPDLAADRSAVVSLQIFASRSARSLASVRIPNKQLSTMSFAGPTIADAAAIRGDTSEGIRSEQTAPDWASNTGTPEAPSRFPLISEYVIESELGRGGMGVVYRANQVGLNRTVALKMILSGTHASREEFDRFRHEAETIARLQHPHIVQIYAVGEHDGVPYFSLEFCEKGSLHRQLNGTPIPPRQAAELVRKLASGMQVAHDHGVIHRDLKPANILIGNDGQPKITDFGLAKQADSQAIGQTVSGEIMGTPSYMAPEQARGDARHVGPAADVYALGVILYELLTGRTPLKAASQIETILQVLEKEPASPRLVNTQVPRDLETVCLKCLEKLPAKRYSSCEALAADLQCYLDGMPISARPVGTPERLMRWCKREPRLAGALFFAILALFGVIGLLAVNARQQARNAIRQNELRLEAEESLYLSQMGRAGAQIIAGEFSGALTTLSHVDPERNTFEHHLLRRQAESTPLTLREHTSWVWSVAFSPDGDRLASGSLDGTVKVWDMRSGMPLLTFRGHAGQVFQVTFSRDGKRLASASDDKSAKIWDAATGAVIHVCRGHSEGVKSLSISPDGNTLATASADKTIKLWDIKTGSELRTLRGHTHTIYGTSFSPDSQRLASISNDRTIRIWDTHTGATVLKLDAHADDGVCIAFSPDGTHIASGSHDRTVKLWDAQAGTLERTLRGHLDLVKAVSFSPDGLIVASASHDRSVVLWNVRTGEKIRTIRGHTDHIFGLAFSPDQTRLASCSADATVKVWDSRTGPGPLTLLGHTRAVNSAAFSPDGKHIATASLDSTVRIWDSQTGREIDTIRGHSDSVRAVAYNPDGTWLATSSQDHTVKFWDVNTASELFTLQGQADWVTSVSYSPDGKLLASGCADGTVKVWDVRDRVGLFTKRLFSAHGNSVTVAFSPDGSQVVSGTGVLGDPAEIKFWDVRAGSEILSLSRLGGPHGLGPTTNTDSSGSGSATQPGHGDMVVAMAFSRDGTRLATGSRDRTAKIWDARTGEELLTLKGHSQIVTSVVFNPDGTRLATASTDQMVKLWDTRSGAEVLTLPAHDDGIRGLAFNFDGTRLASASADCTVKIWDARVPRERRYNPWIEDEVRRRTWGPIWHKQDAERAAQNGDWFAAAFHWEWLIRLGTSDEKVHGRCIDAWRKAGHPERAARMPRYSIELKNAPPVPAQGPKKGIGTSLGHSGGGDRH